jgi:diguanylate cyclase (GGDEF)-like protein
VAGIDRPEVIDPSGVRKLLRLLDPLRRSPAGNVIFRQVEGMLDDIASNHLKLEIAYSGFVNVLLDAFLSHLAQGSSRFVQVKLLQARLQPPLTPNELDTLSEFIDHCADQVRDTAEGDSLYLEEAISPLLSAFGIDEVPVNETPYEEVEVFHDETVATDDVDYPDDVDVPEDEPGELQEADRYDDISEEIPAGQDLNALHRSQLEARRDDIQQLQATLGQQVLETISQNEEFGIILGSVLTSLRQAEDVHEIEDMRWTLIREIEKLMQGHTDLQLVESDSRELSDELTRVRLLSLTDELTGLPNRRAFMRRLEDEVARVQRYGFPMSFVLIDLDHFKDINDKYGHAAGDEVLRVYSKNILSIFRHHDMVARYGGEEFSVLLPNTDSDGAIRALNKVMRRANETRWQANGTISDVPTFSAGVSIYKPGESATAFIERADKALYRAKRLGRNRIELDVTYTHDPDEDGPRRRTTD